MTTGVSLVRENAESMAPPRMLWVSFPFGRPLGKPGDAAFQHRVIAAALDLFRRPSGPVLEDFPLDVDALPALQAACPVNFSRPRDDARDWPARLHNELILLRPWYDESLRRRGRTTFGIFGTAIDAILARVGQLLEAEAAPESELAWLKRGLEDAKTYYLEAMTARPGDYSATELQRMLWQETELGRGMQALYRRFRDHPTLTVFARLIAPREAVGESTGPEIDAGLTPGGDDNV